VESKDVITIRGPQSGDTNFVYATWLRGLYYGNDFIKQIDKDIFMEEYHPVVTGILRRPGISIKIACLKEDEDVILGYSITEGSTLHWVFVKPVWRGIGVAKKLLPDKIITITHYTNLGKKLKSTETIFNPFLAITKEV
jgi:GNAT superfamily N-acetyltransferase